MKSTPRLPSWLLIAATAAILVLMLQLEGARLFPLWRLALQWSPEALASSTAVPPVEIMSGLPTVSLTLDEADLQDPGIGILANKGQHGRDWERPGSISYFEGGRLLFASGLGVRVHGGGSRITSPRQGFRLYFRRRYGARELVPGILFGPDAQPIRRLVVHNDVRRDADRTYWHLVNPLAYDIADAMGAIAPDTKPVRFFLNGEYYGVFVLTERFDERFFAAHWGYDDVLVSQEAFNELWEWVDRTRPLTMEAVAKQVDLDSLTRWFLAVAFAATRDAYQGPGQFLDLSRSEAGWFWVNWDMDLSFRQWDLDSYRYLLERVAEARRGRNDAEPRATILTQLLAGDAQYRDYFRRVFQQVMNHRITDAFLDERYRHYLDVATELRVEHLDYLPRLRRFLERRPAFFRQLTEQWLNTPPSQPLTLTAPRDVSISIDGERSGGGYRGLYFPDLETVLEVPAEYRTRFSGWVVNGRSMGANHRLALKIDRPSHVEALFGGRTPETGVPEPGPPAETPITAPAPVAPQAGPSVIWRRVPPGTFWRGCIPGDADCGREDLPQQQVRVDPFDMMDREVSADDFRTFVAANSNTQRMPRQPEWYADGRHPVVNITWDEAQAYCEWVRSSLPTETQWEYAARGGLDRQLFPWGSQFRGEANAIGTRGADRWEFTAPVGSFDPNGYGLHDMTGNVWEWTASLHRPVGDDGYELRTVRGGSWESAPARLRVSYRTGLSRRGRHNLYVGFRCVRAAAE